jgi:hypothetical protein
MPYITSIERIARTEEILEGIELGLELKFGEGGLRLMSEIRQVKDLELLKAIRQAIRTAATPDELRRVWSEPGTEQPADGTA